MAYKHKFFLCYNKVSLLLHVSFGLNSRAIHQAYRSDSLIYVVLFARKPSWWRVRRDVALWQLKVIKIIILYIKCNIIRKV
jgi:hypothetical protein